jgi:hypothetical protein
MALRYLQTLTEIATEKNSTIIFPIPIELIQPVLSSMAELTTKMREQPPLERPITERLSYERPIERPVERREDGSRRSDGPRRTDVKRDNGMSRL